MAILYEQNQRGFDQIKGFAAFEFKLCSLSWGQDTNHNDWEHSENLKVLKKQRISARMPRQIPHLLSLMHKEFAMIQYIGKSLSKEQLISYSVIIAGHGNYFYYQVIMIT